MERLKALVPKTKKSFSASSSITSSPKIKPKLVQKQKKTSSSSASLIKPHHNNTTYIEFIPSTTSTTSATNKPPKTQPQQPQADKDCISEQEQLHFIYFLKSWTSTGFTSGEYSHFSNDSRSSSDSGFHSDVNPSIDMSSRSLFQYDPFPIHH